MPDEPSLWRLTLDTEHGRWGPRSEVGDHVVEYLAGVLSRTRNTGRPARLKEDEPYSVRLLREGEGHAAFAILTADTDGEAIVTCSVYWTLDRASAALVFATLSMALPARTSPRIGSAWSTSSTTSGGKYRYPDGGGRVRPRPNAPLARSPPLPGPFATGFSAPGATVSRRRARCGRGG